jgi:hypothetical protein
MPTLRKFFKHVAPKLIGESRYGSKTGRSSKYGKADTAGSRPSMRAFPPSSQNRRNRTNYSQFDEESNPPAEDFAMGPIKGVGHNASTSVGNVDETQAAGWMDSDSEKGIVAGTVKPAIMQTKTVTVQYES